MGTVIGMAVMYGAPPMIAIGWLWHQQAPAGAAALLAWALMAAAIAPTLRLYDQPPWRGPLLPAAAVIYVMMTVGSAWAHWRGRGGAWKGRLGPSGAQEHVG